MDGMLLVTLIPAAGGGWFALSADQATAQPVRVVTIDLERWVIVFVMVMEVFVFHLLLDHDGFVNFFLHDLFLLDHGRLVVVVYGFHFRVHVLLLFHFDRYVDDDFPPFAANHERGRPPREGKVDNGEARSYTNNVSCLLVCFHTKKRQKKCRLPLLTLRWPIQRAGTVA